MIEIKGLYKSFDDKTVLSDINADFANGKTNLISVRVVPVRRC